MVSCSWSNVFCMVFVARISATKEPVKPYNLISELHLTFGSATPCPTFHPCLPAFVSTHDTSLTCATTGQIFHLIWRETLLKVRSQKGGTLMHLLCKFHMHACFSWRCGTVFYNSVTYICICHTAKCILVRPSQNT